MLIFWCLCRLFLLTHGLCSAGASVCSCVNGNKRTCDDGVITLLPQSTVVFVCVQRDLSQFVIETRSHPSICESDNAAVTACCNACSEPCHNQTIERVEVDLFASGNILNYCYHPTASCFLGPVSTIISNNPQSYFGVLPSGIAIQHRVNDGVFCSESVCVAPTLMPTPSPSVTGPNPTSRAPTPMPTPSSTPDPTPNQTPKSNPTTPQATPSSPPNPTPNPTPKSNPTMNPASAPSTTATDSISTTMTSLRSSTRVSTGTSYASSSTATSATTTTAAPLTLPPVVATDSNVTVTLTETYTYARFSTVTDENDGGTVAIAIGASVGAVLCLMFTAILVWLMRRAASSRSGANVDTPLQSTQTIVLARDEPLPVSSRNEYDSLAGVMLMPHECDFTPALNHEYESASSPL